MGSHGEEDKADKVRIACSGEEREGKDTQEKNRTRESQNNAYGRGKEHMRREMKFEKKKGCR